MEQPTIFLSHGQSSDAFSFVHIRHGSFGQCKLIYKKSEEEFEVDSIIIFKTMDEAVSYCRAELFAQANEHDLEMFNAKIAANVKEASLTLDMRIANLRGMLFGQIQKLKGSIAW